MALAAAGDAALCALPGAAAVLASAPLGQGAAGASLGVGAPAQEQLSGR